MILNKIKTTAICASLFFAASCTDSFEELISSPHGVADDIHVQAFNNIKAQPSLIFNNVIKIRIIC